VDTTLQDPLVGKVLDGRYRIETRVAAGGMATVYRALDTRLDRVLALKVMHPVLAADAAFVERFIREAKAAARLDHPNVVGVFDQGTDSGYVYLAMEYVAGCTLRDVLREQGALAPRTALDVLEPVLAALGAAHLAGLIHRDMKPENVLIGDDGRVKVADFGLVRNVGTETTSTTGSVLGTVAYLAPEQIEHDTADQRSDVYACGVVLYEMLVGAKPHDGVTPAAVIYQHLHRDVPPPSRAVPALAAGLDALVTRAAARDAQARPADAVALLALLRSVRGGLTGAELDAVPAAALAAPATGAGGSEDRTTVLPRDAASPAELTLNRTSRFQVPPDLVRPVEPAPSGPAGAVRSRRGLAALVAAMALIVGVGAVVWYVGSGQFTSVPAVLALSTAAAEQRLHAAGLGVRLTEDFSETVARDHVISSDPGPGQQVRGNDTVNLVISRGARRITVPDVRDQPLAQAQEKIRDTGLTPGTVTTAFDDAVPAGSVIATDPAQGTARASGSPVAITVSRGKAIVVPDVAGSSAEDAQRRLQAAGLTVRFSSAQVYSDTVPQNSVTQQSLAQGSQAAQGDTVTLTLSKGRQLFPVPDVTGQNVRAASKELTDAGFNVDVIELFFTGKVFNQSPGGGSMHPKGTTITLWAR
jgi:serine/threonine-protein kinase